MLYSAVYDCIYSAEGKGGDSVEDLTKDIRVGLGHYACYSSIYGQIRHVEYAKVTYRIYLYAENIPQKNYNLCTKIETKKILRCLQKTVPFSYKFEKAQYTLSTYSKKLTDFNVLVITVEGNYAQHLWITSMLRCFFEWPYNIAAKEACELQSKLKEVEGIDVSKVNWVNLYLTIVSILGSTDLHGVASSDQQPKALSYKDWNYWLKTIQGSPRLINVIGKKAFSDNVEYINIYNSQEYKKGVKSRAAKYVAAYKEKISWKK